MITLTLTEKEFEFIQELLKSDAGSYAEEVEFFDETGTDPKRFVDERIPIYSKFKLDFWKAADTYCHPLYTKRLKGLYEGMTVKEVLKKFTKETVRWEDEPEFRLKIVV